jgi:putative acetyltransferase
MRRHDERTAEVKRLFVDASARRLGVGRRMLRGLEDAARASGYRAIRLETGIEQPEAMALYESEGYERIPPYGPWKDSPRSVCYEKGITRDRPVE